MESRGGSTAYDSDIAPDGDEWEIRGVDLQAASNGCSEVDRPAHTIQIPTANPDADRASST